MVLGGMRVPGDARAGGGDAQLREVVVVARTGNANTRSNVVVCTPEAWRPIRKEAEGGWERTAAVKGQSMVSRQK